MPNLTWTPRTHDSRNIMDDPNTWNGHGFILDNDKVTSVPPVLSSSAIAVAATYVAYWVGGREYDKGVLLLVAKSGANYKLYNFNTFTLGAEISTAGKAFNAIETFSNIPVVVFDSQFTVIGTTTELGLVDTTADTYTSIAGTGLRHHLVKHLTRLVATDFTGTVYWSVPGTITDWTTTASGAGSTTIGEPVYGLCVVQNKLVLLTPNAVHYGYPTGTLSPVFRFEKVISNTVVCDDMQSVAQYGDTVFYKNATGVYKLVDGQQINIGEPVWETAMALGDSANPFKGDIIYTFDASTPRRPQHADVWYVLTPLKSGNAAPIMGYNITKGAWATIFTSSSANLEVAYTGKAAFALDSIRLLRFGNNLVSYWSQTSGDTTRTLLLKSAPIMLEDPTRDYVSDMAYVWYTDCGQITVAFTIAGILNGSEVTKTSNVTIGNTVATGKVLRARIPVRGITAQTFQMTIAVTTASKIPVSINKVIVALTDGGSARA